MSNKLLIVGNGDHQFVYNYTKWLKKKGDFSKIDILTDREISNEFSKVYSEIFSIDKYSNLYKTISKLKGVRRLYRFYLYRRLIKKLPEYDFVHVHFMNVDNTYLAGLFINSKRILSIWGSDFYRAKEKQKVKLRDTCNNADVITFTNELTKQNFKKEFKWNKDNLKICRFGLAPLEILEQFQETRIESKEKLGWDKKKIAVTIGYNLSREQQHIEILQQINSLREYTKEIEVILPITYGGNQQYKEQLIAFLENQKYSYRYYDEFLDDITVCRIRNASDIMIQLQTTDQFSGSMQEHLFTRNVVITGSWLPYKTMKDHRVYFIEIDAISELADSLINVFENYREHFSKTNRNPEAILKLSSWQHNISDWLTLYN